MFSRQAVPSSVRPALDAALGEASAALDAGDWQLALKRVWASKWTDPRHGQSGVFFALIKDNKVLRHD